ncbi:MAG TPA: energy transducer TonB, partial [Candidatus Polarisedimenticolia bacterium]|nr:energy transducer TonB [Candidatus Polarisedimenticolia bacterium]
GSSFTASWAEETRILSPQRARLLPVPSERATEAMALVLEELGFRLRVRQPADGLFISKALGVDRAQKHGLHVAPVNGLQPVQIELHAFVSRAVEPAHVHVEAIVTSVMRYDGIRSYAYARGDVEEQVLGALERHLGVTGEPIPSFLEERRQAAARLMKKEADLCPAGEIRLPEILPASKLKPLFPAGPLRGGESGRVRIIGRIVSDGAFVPAQVVEGSGASRDLETASLAAVGFWRYRPFRNGPCSFDVPMTVAIDFKNNR